MYAYCIVVNVNVKEKILLVQVTSRFGLLPLGLFNLIAGIRFAVFVFYALGQLTYYRT